jgi:hypothetical protein
VLFIPEAEPDTESLASLASKPASLRECLDATPHLIKSRRVRVNPKTPTLTKVRIE